VRWLGDATLDHLREVADLPDLEGTKYELQSRIARGGMGTVYRALDRELDHQVALKVLSEPYSDPAAPERLRREAQILARLEHPGIVPVHDVGTLPDGRVFYVMKLVRGDRLDQHVTPTTTVTELLRIFGRICEAAAFAHAHGVIHRDLKPENIMVGPFGEVLVMDWGVAKLSSGAEPAGSQPSAPSSGPQVSGTSDGAVIGTPGYMAPEQARGEVDRVDERSDIYALGAILQFLLAGRSPSRPLQAMCRKALAPEPDGRYSTVQELTADVGRFLGGEAVSAHREGLLERTWRVVSRYRVPILLVLSYLLMRVALLFFSRR
jgi:serine/threonine protein kinase